jgi:hypothetical protein
MCLVAAFPNSSTITRPIRLIRLRRHFELTVVVKAIPQRLSEQPPRIGKRARLKKKRRLKDVLLDRVIGYGQKARGEEDEEG